VLPAQNYYTLRRMTFWSLVLVMAIMTGYVIHYYFDAPNKATGVEHVANS